jgi:(2R)-3-sulfolactate dehydrogenase (NADP+)
MTAEQVSAEDLERIVAEALIANRTSPANARSVAAALIAAEIDGQPGHGLSRVASYAAQARSGKVDGFATPRLERRRPGALMVDVASGFAYPAFDIAIAALPDAAREAGIAAVGFVRSHHFGVVGRHVERLAERGLVALAFGNTPGAMAAAGGRKAVFGTNPIAFAAPIPGGAPLVIDLALSEVARGRIMAAAQRGEPIPQGWAFDSEGGPTTDAKAALAGSLRPAGGAKGAALALMVEVLAVALTGANPSFRASSFFDGDGPAPGVGQLLIAIDPDAFGGRDLLAARLSAIAGEMLSDPGVRLPGAKRLARRSAFKCAGTVAVEEKALEQLKALGRPRT